MDKIIFVINSNKIHLYFWKCIELILYEFKNIQITVFIDDSGIKQNKYSFNPIIDYIDKRFSNLKTKPFTLIDIEQNVNNLKKIRIVKKIDDLELSDWIILEYEQEDIQKFNKYTRNGLLLLALNYNSLINSILNKSLIKLSIVNRSFKYNKWEEVFSVNLKNEIGLKNNTHKILLNYSVYLFKFLRNFNIQEINSSNAEVLINTVKTNLFLKLKITFYYSKLLFKIFERKIKKAQFNWKIGIKKDDIIIFLKQPKKSFWADPFMIKAKDGNTFIYFEELKDDNLGKIACVELNPNLEIIKKEDIIDRNYHMSFPNIFFKDGSYYMIPETSQDNTLQLYKCSQFPFKWDFQINLMENIKLLDAVWVYHNDFYWIFANKIEDYEHDNNEKLYLYYSKNLFTSSWTSHIKNPIITDAGLARNAGNFILKKGKLLRISQNCRDGYGQNVVINEVSLLTENDYIEKKVNEIFPPKGYIGSHTFNTDGNLEVLDFLIKE